MKIVFFYSAYTFDWNVLPINKLRTTHTYTSLHWNDSSVEETVPLARVELNVVTRCQVLGHSCLWPQHLRMAVSKLDMDISLTSLLASITGLVDVLEIKIN